MSTSRPSPTCCPATNPHAKHRVEPNTESSETPSRRQPTNQATTARNWNSLKRKPLQRANPTTTTPPFRPSTQLHRAPNCTEHPTALTASITSTAPSTQRKRPPEPEIASERSAVQGTHPASKRPDSRAARAKSCPRRLNKPKRRLNNQTKSSPKIRAPHFLQPLRYVNFRPS